MEKSVIKLLAIQEEALRLQVTIEVNFHLNLESTKELIFWMENSVSI